MRFILNTLFGSISALLVVCSHSCKSTGKENAALQIRYPSPTPDSTSLSFLPGVVSKDSLDFNAAFSPYGRSFYFSRSENGKLKIYVTHYDEQKWIEPVRSSFTD